MADTEYGLVRAGLIPVRAEPNFRAEQVSQEALGSVLEIQERESDWVRAKGEDGYEGWVGLGGLLTCDRDRARAWRAGPDGAEAAVALDAKVEDEQGRAMLRLPWGARVALDGERALLPDGRSGRLVDGRWVLAAELPQKFPPRGAAVVETAWGWMGVPYLWGGRTRWGADCSGLAQAIYRLHGVALPRDSHQQANCGELVESGPKFRELRPGDLIFFRATGSQQIVHVALSLGGSDILHAAEMNGSVAVDSLAGDSELERALARRAVGVRRFFRD